MFTSQSPIHSGFGSSSTALEVIKGIDLTGKFAVITGGSSGLGFETVRAFRAAGAKVLVPVRDMEKGRIAFGAMPDVELFTLDLLDPSSIDQFSEQVLSITDKLHILVNNAGVMAAPLMRDGRGNESQFSANHLGHFQLTCRLFPALAKSQGARVISLSSYGHRRGAVDFRDPNFKRREYDPWVAYGQSKTANALFSVALDSLGQGRGVRAFSVHPGGIMTDLTRHLSQAALAASGLLDVNGKAIIDPKNNRKSVEQGAATTVWCSTSPMLNGMGGVYCADCDIAVALLSDDSTELHGVRPRATDPVAAGRLWQMSEELTGTTLD
jgi:NAD(P)-dependent dehydrogenase (short-subunit alcohol dehydrogenase family)